MIESVIVEPLAEHVGALRILETWFEAEWPDYYGASGRGNAARDVRSFAQRGRLPVGVVALTGGNVCGIAALRAESIPSHAHLSPWATAGYVVPARRGHGIGGLLLVALEDQARELGFANIFCATRTAETLLVRSGWTLLERALHDGQALGIYRKAL